jgi:hypothetical protein
MSLRSSRLQVVRLDEQFLGRHCERCEAIHLFLRESESGLFFKPGLDTISENQK